MPLTLVQKNKAGSAVAVASQACVYGATPTQGNLLIAGANSDNTGSMTSTGWTLGTSSVNASGLYQYWKIAGAGESTTVTWSPASSASTEVWIAEDSGNPASPLDQIASAAGSGTSCPTGTTPATAQADELAAAMVGESGG